MRSTREYARWFYLSFTTNRKTSSPFSFSLSLSQSLFFSLFFINSSNSSAFFNSSPCLSFAVSGGNKNDKSFHTFFCSMSKHRSWNELLTGRFSLPCIIQSQRLSSFRVHLTTNTEFLLHKHIQEKMEEKKKNLERICGNSQRKKRKVIFLTRTMIEHIFSSVVQ